MQIFTTLDVVRSVLHRFAQYGFDASFISKIFILTLFVFLETLCFWLKKWKEKFTNGRRKRIIVGNYTNLFLNAILEQHLLIVIG